MQVESRLRFSISASAVNARNMVSNVPSSRHLANRAYTDCQGPYASGNSRHCAPLRTIQSIPLSIFRSSFRGRPRFPVLPAGSNFFTRSHCAFVNSYRFMALFSHFYLVCAIFIFQTSPNMDHQRNSKASAQLWALALLIHLICARIQANRSCSPALPPAIAINISANSPFCNSRWYLPLTRAYISTTN